MTPELFLEVQTLSSIDADWSTVLPRMPAEISDAVGILRRMARYNPSAPLREGAWQKILVAALTTSHDVHSESRRRCAIAHVLDSYEGAVFSHEQNMGLLARLKEAPLGDIASFAIRHHLRRLSMLVEGRAEMPYDNFFVVAGMTKKNSDIELRRPRGEYAAPHYVADVLLRVCAVFAPKNDPLCGKRKDLSP